MNTFGLRSRCAWTAASAAVLGLVASPALASGSNDFWNFLSGTGAAVYLVAGTGLPLLEDGNQAKNHTLRNIDSLVATFGISEGISALTQEERPDGSGHDSFPSDHAALAFNIATMESAWHPRQAPLWYGGATLIAASRVALHKHYVHDVLFGALLGYGSARWELSQRHGLILTPFINGGGSGVSLVAKF